MPSPLSSLDGLAYAPLPKTHQPSTIGDPGDLSRRLGVKPITKIPVDPGFAEKA
jgi:hypothetical protein